MRINPRGKGGEGGGEGGGLAAHLLMICTEGGKGGEAVDGTNGISMRGGSGEDEGEGGEAVDRTKGISMRGGSGEDEGEGGEGNAGEGGDGGADSGKLQMHSV